MGLRNRGVHKVEIKFEGNWLKFNRFGESIDKYVMAAMYYAQSKFAHKYKRALRKNIREGGRRFGYPPHSTKYATKKARFGGPAQLFVWSMSFHNAVDVISNSRGTRWAVGIRKGLKRPSYHGRDTNRLQIHEYANVLEHGSSKRDIPARPIFRDTFAKNMGGIRGMKKIIIAYMIEYLTIKGFRPNKY